MSYQVLARKWRPRTFAEMVGQSHVLQTLTNALDNNRLHHAYLFTGTRGVGKTTLARILAKCLNCEQGVSSRPCGSCSACISIDEGRFVDLIEVDAASRAKVDETRDLMDNVQYAPSTGRYKIYLIDEVHMFSNHSFNALLKTLEEPPPHVKFLLATTEAKKIPVTILSRCLQFNLKLLGVDLIEEQLTRILKEEQIDSDEISRHLISIAANGSMRDALSLLDQAIAHGGGSLMETQVRAMLGSIDSRELSGLLQALIAGDARQVLEQISFMAEHHPDFDSVLVELLSRLQSLAIIQLLGDAPDPDCDPELVSLSKQADKEEIQLYYQIGINGRRDLPLAPDPRSGFEMILLRMLAFRPAGRLTQEQLSAGTSGTTRQDNEDPQVQPVRFSPGQSASGLQQDTGNPVASVQTDDWQDIIDEMALAGLVKELAGHCILREHTRDRVHLVLSPSQEHLMNTSQKDRLVSALKTRFGDELKVTITVEDSEHETPVQKKNRVEEDRQKAAEKSVESDPKVKLMQDMFNATVDKSTIRPTNSN